MESRDAQAAVRFLRQSAPGEKVGLIGVSLGGASALLASPSVDAVVLEMVYPTLHEALENRLAMRLGSGGKVFSPLLSWQMRVRLGFGEDALRPIDHAKTLKIPKLFIVGEKDRHTTLEQSRRFFEAASPPKELWIVKGAAHTDLYQVARQEYKRRVLGFFEKHLR